MPIENTSDTQCPDAGYSCPLSGCRTAVVPHLVVQHLGKMYATQSSAGDSSSLYFSAFQLSDWHFGLHLFDNVCDEAEVVLHEEVARLEVALRPAAQVGLLLLRREGFWKRVGILRQMERKKQAARQEQQSRRKH